LRVCGAVRADPRRPGVGVAPRPKALPMPAAARSDSILDIRSVVLVASASIRLVPRVRAGARFLLIG
jgi:hypothetical protein